MITLAFPFIIIVLSVTQILTTLALTRIRDRLDPLVDTVSDLQAETSDTKGHP